MSQCTVPECQRPAPVRYCKMHQRRLRCTGTTDPGPNAHLTIEERFSRHAQKSSSGCWGWNGSINNKGYGRLGPHYGHRVSYELHVGPIPDGQFVLHRCDNPPCTNPAHLFLGSHRDNMADAARKGRLSVVRARGPKLTTADAIEIRRLHRLGAGATELGRRYGVSPTTVRSVTSGRSWKSAGAP